MSEDKAITEQTLPRPIIEERNAYYCGTTKGRSWWRRYIREGWFSRGNCEAWVDRKGLHFRRYLTHKVMTLYHREVTEITVGKWHAGKFTGTPIIKIAWKKDDLELVSGFSVSRTVEGTDRWVTILKDCVSKGG
jgi:hypothetical protein